MAVAITITIRPLGFAQLKSAAADDLDQQVLRYRVVGACDKTTVALFAELGATKPRG